MKVINGEGLLLGRVCSYAAKAALLGEEVRIVNCEKIIISGERSLVLAKERKKKERRGYPLKSQNYSRLPDRFVRRTVRGMLPRKTERGRLAWKRVMCYAKVPAELAGEMMTIEKAKAEKLPTLKQVRVGEVCNWLRGKK